MSDLIRRIKKIISSEKFAEKILDTITDELMRELSKDIGGRRVYIASAGNKAYKLKRNAQIKSRFTGDNYAELSKIFNLGKRQIRRIIQK